MESLHNPYEPPKANVDSKEVAEDAELAGKGRRFGTLIIDYMGTAALNFVLAFVLSLAMGPAAVALFEGGEGLFVGCMVVIFYYVVFEWLWGRTPGKFVFGTIVVDARGKPPKLGTVFIRTLCRFVPFEPFSFFGTRGWHDGISNTRVILAR